MVEKNDVSLETQDSVDVKRNEPQLRFKEFNGPWKKTILGKVSIDEMYGMNSAAKDFDGVNKYIRITDISETSHKFAPNPLTSPEGQLNDKFRLKEGDIVFARTGASTGKSYLYNKKDGKLYFAGFLIKFHIDKACPQFVFYNTLRNNYENWVKVISVRSGQPGINAEEYKNFMFYLPSIKEQEKIANFLSLIDKKIEFLEKTLVLYQKIKKHILEQIFANLKCESESLDKVTFYQEGPGVRNYQYTKEGIKLLNVGNFVENELILENTDRYISEEEAYGKYKHFLVDEGDLLIACSGIKAEYFDEKITFAKKEHLPLCMNTSTMRFKTLNENKLNLNYLKWYFQTVMFKKQIFGVLTGSAQFNFGPTHLKYLKVLIPPIEQQIVISNFLDFLKNHTDKLSKEIYLMKEYKKGLLQKMFV